MPPGEQAAVSFSHRFDSPGDHVVEAAAWDADLLDIDNHRWLSVPVKDHLRVLCVDGKPASAADDRRDAIIWPWRSIPTSAT